MRLFYGLPKKSLEANVITGSSAVSACEKSSGRWDEAQGSKRVPCTELRAIV